MIRSIFDIIGLILEAVNTFRYIRVKIISIVTHTSEAGGEVLFNNVSSFNQQTL